MRILCSIHDLDDNLVPTDDEQKTREFYEEAIAFSELITQANAGSIPPIGIWTGREEEIVRGAFRIFRLPNFWSAVESGVALVNLATGDKTYHPRISPETRRVFQEIRGEVIPRLVSNNPNLRLYPGKEINVALERHNKDIPIQNYLERVKEALEKYLPFIEIDYSSIAIDIRPEGVNKGTALEVLTRLTGIQPEEILGTGDSAGDFPMLQRVGFVGCPSNASPECKAFVESRGECGYVSELPYVAGVNAILRHFSQRFAKI